MPTIAFSRSNRAPLPAEIADKLPVNRDAERIVLGAILVDPTPASMKSAREVLVPDDFSLEQDRRIFRNMLSLDDSNQPIESVSLLENLERNNEVDAAGGGAYIASLMDGMPRISDIAYYANIVKEKSRRRQIIHQTLKIQNDAISGSSTSEELYAQMESFAKQRTNGDNPAVIVDFHELLTLELPEPRWMIEPLLTRGGTMMLYSWAGWGKSYIATELAFSLAVGSEVIFGGHRGPGGAWPLHGPCRVLYLYGEMHGSKIRERIVQIAKGHSIAAPEKNFLGVMSKDYQTISRAPRCARAWRPSISTGADRRYVEERLFGEGYELLVLDNISTLWSAAREEQSKQVAILKDWFIDLNMRGLMVLVLQHSGKSGDFLGDSSQIHILDALVKLKRPGNYRKSQGLRVIVDVEKNRYECSDPKWLAPFETQLQVTPDQGAQWFTRPAIEAQREAAFQMFKNKMKPPEVAIELGIHRSTAYRYHTQFQDRPNAKDWNEQDEDE